MGKKDMSYTLPAEHLRWAEEVFEKMKGKLSAECSRIGSDIPYSPRKGDGKYHDCDKGEGLAWWTNGFWPGMLWQMYHATGDNAYRAAAEGVEDRFDQLFEEYDGLHHDVGFMWLHTAVADYRLTQNPKSRRRGLHAASILAGRYNPAGEYIRAWNGDRTSWIIVDCMMNIPLLYWASRELNDPRFAYVAKRHADTCRRVTVREDGSCNHISILDPDNGECLENPGGQGYASGSSWSRGNAWAVYGFALSYVHTKDQKYLDTAKKIAHYFLSNLAINDWLPVVDFRAPAKPVKYDSTAGVIAACGLLEIAKHVDENEKALYTESAVKILRACESKFCNWNPDEDAILGFGTESYHNEDGAHVPIIYGDYFLTEAVLRLLGKDFLIW